LDDIIKSKTIVNDFFDTDVKFMETTLGDEMPTCDSKTECGKYILGYTTPYRKRPLQTFSLKLYFVLYFLKGGFFGPNYYITYVWPSDIARNQVENTKRKKTPSFTSLRARRIK